MKALARRRKVDHAVHFAEAQDAYLAVTVLTKDFLNLYALAPYGGHALPVEPTALGREDELDTIKAATSRARIPVEVRGIVEDPMLLRGVSRVEARSTNLLLVGPAVVRNRKGLISRSVHLRGPYTAIRCSAERPRGAEAAPARPKTGFAVRRAPRGR